MPIIRAPRPQSNFYLLDKQISEDQRLSWAARGLLVFLLGKPDYWRVSVQALVNETAEASMPSGRDAVYRILRELQEARYVTRAQAKGEGGTFAEVDYLVSEDPAAPHTGNPEAAPLTALPDTAQPLTANPTLVSTDKAVRTEKAASTEDSPPASLPSAEKPKRRKRTPISLQAFLDECKASGAAPIPEDDSIFDWGTKTGVPWEMLKVCWKVFRERFLEVPTKKQADWRAHFRNAVRGNWFHLWYFDDAEGMCRLTTAGEQARRAHDVDSPYAPPRLAAQKFDPVAYVNRNRVSENHGIAQRRAASSRDLEAINASANAKAKEMLFGAQSAASGHPRSCHSGFDQITYREGVNEDGSL
jgi:hypothetical protein